MPHGLTWRQHSKNTITKTVEWMNTNITEGDCRQCLSAAYPYGERDGYPYKVWCDEVRKYLQDRFHPETIPAKRSPRFTKTINMDPSQFELFDPPYPMDWEAPKMEGVK